MEFDLTRYLETIARESVYIKHTDQDPHYCIASGYMEMEDLLNKLTRSEGIQLIAIDDTSGSFTNSSDVNLYDRSYFQFVILKHTKDLYDMKERNNVLKECKKIGKVIFSRMKKDQYEARSLPPIEDNKGLRQFEQNSIQYFTVGPIGDNYMGIQFSFTTGNQDTVKFNQEEWSL